MIYKVLFIFNIFFPFVGLPRINHNPNCFAILFHFFYKITIFKLINFCTIECSSLFKNTEYSDDTDFYPSLSAYPFSLCSILVVLDENLI